MSVWIQNTMCCILPTRPESSDPSHVSPVMYEYPDTQSYISTWIWCHHTQTGDGVTSGRYHMQKIILVTNI